MNQDKIDEAKEILKQKPPCKDCRYREVGCHSGCIDYVNWIEAVETKKQVEKLEKITIKR